MIDVLKKNKFQDSCDQINKWYDLTKKDFR